MTKPKPRTLKLLAANRVQITLGKDADVYEVARIPGVADGLAWRHVDEPDRFYHCAAWTDGTYECDCWGFLRHRNCKHAAATPKVLALLDKMEMTT